MLSSGKQNWRHKSNPNQTQANLQMKYMKPRLREHVQQSKTGILEYLKDTLLELVIQEKNQVATQWHLINTH